MSNVVRLNPRHAGLLDHTGQPIKQRRYEASSHLGRFAKWFTQSTDADAANNDPITLRNRSHDLVRNNPWANKALQTVVGNAVGYGIRAQFKSKSKNRAATVQSMWEQHCETRAIDADGMLDIYGLQSLAFRAMVESGEVLIRLRPRRPEDRLPLPFQVQIIESDYLAENEAEAVNFTGGNTFHRGIEFDGIGRRVAYHLYREHPGAKKIFAATPQTTRVPASEIIHLFRKDRPGQQRGVSWFAPVTKVLRDLDVYEDAYLVRQQLANLFALFMISNDPNDFADEMEQELPDLQPGTSYFLKPGTDIKFSTPPPAGEDPAYRDSQLRRAAAGFGISYESMTGNFSEVNFSSARMGAQEMGRNLDSWQWITFIPLFCDGIKNWFLDSLSMQTGLNVADVTCEWTPPARVQVDPNKETDSLLKSCKGGFTSVPEAIRRQGFDPVAVAMENKEYFDLLDSLDIKIESDYRQSAKQPQATMPETAPEATQP